MQAEQQSERERFEAWCKQDNPRYEPTDDSPLNRRDWKVWKARAALSHPSTPQGWKLVPVEPTKEMLAAGESKREEGETNDEYCAWNINAPRDYWDAMLDAAPPPPEQGGKG